MKNILIAVDDTKSTREMFAKTAQIVKCMAPQSVVLVYVEKFEGRSLIDEMLGDAELSTLREVLEGTEYKNALDQKANSILEFYRKALAECVPAISAKTVTKTGHPGEMIVATAKEEAVDMIIIGSRGKRVSHLFMGSVSREVANTAEVPVLIVK